MSADLQQLEQHGLQPRASAAQPPQPTSADEEDLEEEAGDEEDEDEPKLKYVKLTGSLTQCIPQWRQYLRVRCRWRQDGAGNAQWEHTCPRSAYAEELADVPCAFSDDHESFDLSDTSAAFAYIYLQLLLTVSSPPAPSEIVNSNYQY